MNNQACIVSALICVLAATRAMAELPEHSILNRYGVTSGQLPGVQAGESTEAPSNEPRFKILPQEPWRAAGLGEATKSQMTGNISIDRSMQQEHERCLRLRGQSLWRRGESVSCDEGVPIPGTGAGFTR